MCLFLQNGACGSSKVNIGSSKVNIGSSKVNIGSSKVTTPPSRRKGHLQGLGFGDGSGHCCPTGKKENPFLYGARKR